MSIHFAILHICVVAPVSTLSWFATGTPPSLIMVTLNLNT